MSSRLNGKSLLKTASKQKAFLAVIVMFIIMIFFKTNFYSAYNLLDMLNSASINEILAAGVTLVIICAGCDLSVGGILSLSGIVTIELMEYMPILPAILCALALGALIGFINGFFVVHQKTEPFIITLGMGMVLKGIAQEMTDAHPISPSNAQFMKIANGKLFGTIPYLVIYMIIVLVIVGLILRYTHYGRNCYAVGGDYEVAVYAGINARRTKWAAFVISGTIAALGGVLLSSKLNSGSSIYGDTTPLIIHCGAVIGGTSLVGGKGGILQTFIGLLALAVLQNCMNMLLITAYIQQLVQGIVIVGILWLDCFGMKLKRETV
jgi:ribose transport system permease protein